MLSLSQVAKRLCYFNYALFAAITCLAFRTECLLADSDREVAASPKQPWGDFTLVEEKEGYPWWQDVLLWVPNRLADLIDVVKIDVGAGPAYGGVVRLTKYGQVGYRSMSPTSVRVGNFGRKAPVLVESSNEFGVGPSYVNSKDRKVCPGEFGVGADLLIVGAYGGICVEELVDFAAGLLFIDLMDDDFK